MNSHSSGAAEPDHVEFNPASFDPSKFPVFQGLTDQECRDVLAQATSEKHASGERIIREGNSNQILWFILSGQCQVCKTTEGGGEVELAVLGPGTVFGDMSFFNPAPHSASVIARSNVEVLRLERSAFDELERSRPNLTSRIGLNTIKMLSDRLRRMDEWAHSLLERLEGERHHEEWREFRSRLYSDWEF